MISRTKYIDEVFTKTIKEEFDQILILEQNLTREDLDYNQRIVKQSYLNWNHLTLKKLKLHILKMKNKFSKQSYIHLKRFQ